MKILNAKNQNLVFKLDNGSILVVKPGEVSAPFIGTKILLNCVINAGSPQEVGIIVTNSYELQLLQQLPAGYQYLHQSEEVAKAALLEGKKFEDIPDGLENDTVITKLKARVSDLELQLTNANELASVLRKKAESSDDSELRKTLDKKNDELTESNAKIYQLTTDIDEFKSVESKLRSELKEKDTIISNFKVKVAELESKLKSEESKVDPGVVEDLKTKLSEEQKKSSDYEKELVASKKSIDELNEKLNAVSSTELTDEQKLALENYPKLQLENEQLKADGEKLFKSQEIMRNSLVELKTKFGVEFIDGHWTQIQPTNPTI